MDQQPGSQHLQPGDPGQILRVQNGGYCPAFVLVHVTSDAVDYPGVVYQQCESLFQVMCFAKSSIKRQPHSYSRLALSGAELVPYVQL